MRQSRTSRIVVLLGLLAVGIAAVWFWYSSTFLRGPLDGITRHDFGNVLLKQVPTTVEHRFVLRNGTSDVIELQTGKPDCACVSLPVQPQAIGPGESIELPLTMKIHPGTTKVRIQLALGNGATQSLWVQATGKLPSTLAVIPAQIWFEEVGTTEGQGTAFFTVTAYMFDTNNPPAQPRVTGPAEIVAEIGEWKLRHRPRTGVAPTEWQAPVILRASEPRALIGAVLEVAAEGLDSVAVQIIAPEQAPRGSRPRSVIDVPVQPSGSQP